MSYISTKKPKIRYRICVRRKIIVLSAVAPISDRRRQGKKNRGWQFCHTGVVKALSRD